MLSGARIWKKPALFTLTIDRRGFESPQAAFLAVTRAKFVARLMKLLGVKLWAWALEFQQLTGDGWPHWHLLIDLSDLPGGRIDLRRAWALWRDTWHLGGIDLQAKDVDVQTPQHAINYLTKYLTKMPAGGFPPWVMKSHGLRFVQGCRRLGPLVAKPKKPAADADEPCAADVLNPRDYADQHERKKRALRQRSARRSHLERLARCMLSTNLLEPSVDHTTGQLRTAYRGTLPGSPLYLAGLAARGLIDADIRMEENEWGRTRFVMYGGEVEFIRQQLDDLGAVEWAETEATDSAAMLLAANAYSARDAQSTST